MDLVKQNMQVYSITKKIIILLACTSCMKTPWLSRISPGYRTAVAPWIAQSNGNAVQKSGWWDGCQMANTREIIPTNVRHLSRVSMDSAYIKDPSYSTAWKFGYYQCHVNRAAYMQPFLRGWNAIGFKGDGIAYKSE
jgi:hypothetical protein